MKANILLSFLMFFYVGNVIFAQVDSLQGVGLDFPPRIHTLPNLVITEDDEKELAPNAFVFPIQQPKWINRDSIISLIGDTLEHSRIENIKGYVHTRILISKKGKYIKHIVTKQENDFIRLVVEDYISKVRFEPALRAGKPIKYWINVPFKFR